MSSNMIDDIKNDLSHLIFVDDLDAYEGCKRGVSFKYYQHDAFDNNPGMIERIKAVIEKTHALQPDGGNGTVYILHHDEKCKDMYHLLSIDTSVKYDKKLEKYVPFSKI